MPRFARRLRQLAPIAVTALVAAALAACGGGGSSNNASTSGGGGGAPGRDAALAKLVPSKIRSAGEIVVATDPTYAPMEFTAADNKTIVGVDPDLGKAIGQLLGVRLRFVRAGFDGIIPGISAGKYGLSMSSFSDTKEREKVVDFVTYGQAGTSVMVKSGNPRKISPTGNSLCGTRVAVEKGTTQSDTDIPARDKRCRAAGRAAIKALVFPDQQAANLALSSSRADAVLADTPVAAYAAAKSSGQFEVTGKPYAVDRYGIAVPKNSGKLAQALRGALAKLIADGRYAAILKRWDVSTIAISKPAINAAAG